MSAIGREQVRDGVVALMQAGLIGTGKPTQAVYNGLQSDFGSLAPVVMITDAGIRRKPRELTGTKYRSWVRLLALVWVADADTAAGWTDEMAENQLGAIEQAIADVISANRRTTNWKWIGYDDAFTEIEALPDEGGHSYLVETIPLLVEVFDA